MRKTNFSLAPENLSLAKTVLTLSALGIFSKLLNVDLSGLSLMGVTLSPDNSQLIPGFLGIALVYIYVAYCVSRIELSTEYVDDPETIPKFKKHASSKPRMVFLFLLLPFSVFVYAMPTFLGGFSIYLLWSDITAVWRTVWSIASGHGLDQAVTQQTFTQVSGAGRTTMLKSILNGTAAVAAVIAAFLWFRAAAAIVLSTADKPATIEIVTGERAIAAIETAELQGLWNKRAAIAASIAAILQAITLCI